MSCKLTAALLSQQRSAGQSASTVVSILGTGLRAVRTTRRELDTFDFADVRWTSASE